MHTKPLLNCPILVSDCGTQLLYILNMEIKLANGGGGQREREEGMREQEDVREGEGD